MTDRRRNGLILLLVAGLLAASLRRHRDQADAARPRPQGRRRARLPGRADPAGPDGDAGSARPRARHHPLARRPARRRRAGDPALGQRPDLGRPARRPEHQTRAAAGRHARPALLLRLGDQRPQAGRQAVAPQLPAQDPDAQRISQAAGDPSQGQPLYDAVKLASRQTSRREHEKRRRGSAPPTTCSTETQPLARRARARRSSRPAVGDRQNDACRPAARCIAVPQGTSCCRRAAATANDRVPIDDPTARFYVLRDQVALSGTDIKDPQQNFNQTRTAPTSTFRFTGTGKTAFHDVTRTISQRGTTLTLPGVNPQTVLQHFAVALDSRLISVASIDPQRLPGRHRRRERRGDRGRLHDPERAGPREPAPARRAADRAQADLAVAGLGHARQAGAAPGPDRGRRRPARRRALPDRLLPRARRDRRPAPWRSTRSTSSR